MSEDFYKTICRVCLNIGNSESLVPLHDNTAEYGLSCFGKAVECFTNICFENHSLPSYMCRKCLFLLKQAIVFKKTCEKSQETLTTLIEDCDGSESTIKELVTDYVIYKTYFPDRSVEGNPVATHHNVKTEDETVQQPKSGKLVMPTQEIESDQSETGNYGDYFQFGENFNSVDIGNSEVIIEEDVDDLLSNLEKAYKMDPKRICHLKKYVHRKRVQCQSKSLVQKRKKRKEERNLKCNVCNRVLANTVTYNNHMQSHTGFRFVCDKCGKGFSYYALLQSHQANMHEIGCLICKECGYKAGRKFELTEHERIHTGERPFACDKCGKTFRRQFIWKKHLLYHEEKTVQCTHCPRKFYKLGAMQAHCNNIHERVLVYQCSECEITYAKPSTVRKHLEQKHGVPRVKQGKITKIRLGKPTN